MPPRSAEINPTTDAITEFAVPTANSVSFFITAGPDGNLWFTESNADRLGDDQPDDPRNYRIPRSLQPALRRTGSRQAPTATSGSPMTGLDSIGVDTLNTHTPCGDPAASRQRHRRQQFLSLGVVQAEDSHGNVDPAFNSNVLLAAMTRDPPRVPAWAARRPWQPPAAWRRSAD